MTYCSASFNHDNVYRRKCNYTEALLDYLRNDHCELSHVISLIDSGANISEYANSPILLAAAYGHIEILKYFIACMHNEIDSVTVNRTIIKAATNGHINVLKFLITLPGADVTTQSNEAFIKAASNNQLDTVKFLLTFPGVIAHAQSNSAFVEAARDGHLEMLEFLITLPYVDPADQNNCAVMSAATNGHLVVLKYLTTLPNVDITAWNYQAIIEASEYGFHDIVEFLLSLPAYANLTLNIFLLCMIKASISGYLDTIKCLLAHKRDKYDQADMDIIYNHSMCRAAGRGHLDVVKYFILELGADPTWDENSAVIYAAERNYLSVFEFLLTLPNVDVTDQRNRAIKTFAHGTALESFYSNPTHNTVQNDAKLNGYLTIYSILLYYEAKGDLVDISVSDTLCTEKILKYVRPTVHKIAISLIELPTPVIIEIIEQSLTFTIYIPYHLLWNMVVKIKHNNNIKSHADDIALMDTVSANLDSIQIAI